MSRHTCCVFFVNLFVVSKIFLNISSTQPHSGGGKIEFDVKVSLGDSNRLLFIKHSCLSRIMKSISVWSWIEEGPSSEVELLIITINCRIFLLCVSLGERVSTPIFFHPARPIPLVEFFTYLVQGEPFHLASVGSPSRTWTPPSLWYVHAQTLPSQSGALSHLYYTTHPIL